MLLTPAEILRQQPADYWFCLKARPKREHVAAACLRQNLNVEAFCPRMRLRRHTNRGPVWFIESMFPGYFFARFNYGTCHRRVKQAHGVSGIVQFGDRVGLLSDELISEIKRRMDKDGLVEIDQRLEPGQNVHVTQGPFEGFEAVVTRLIGARDRVEILIEWMGRSLQAEADVADLLPLTAPRS
jgi:transcriptional antiterminator RfaH